MLASLSPWVELIAEEIHDRARVPGPPFDVLTIASALGYRVQRPRSLGGPTGVLAGGTIAVVRGAAPDVVAMTIGHELAHAFNDRWRVIDPAPEWLLEVQMDAVAMAVLAPRASLPAVCLRPPQSVEILSLTHALPIPLAFQRLCRLGLFF